MRVAARPTCRHPCPGSGHGHPREPVVDAGAILTPSNLYRAMERCIAVCRSARVCAAQQCSSVSRVSTEKPVFDLSGPAYVYMQLADHIEGRIRDGELLPATRLPGERDLAEEYGVALGTARRAVQELRDRGLVLTLPAKGTYIKAPKEN